MSDNADQLLKIERQGAEFVRALLPQLPSINTFNPTSNVLWRMCTDWRQWSPDTERRLSSHWRCSVGLWREDRAFFAGAETAIREYEATT